MDKESDAYDVVVDVLTKHAQELWRMTEKNMRSEYVGLNIMDDIRLKQIREINECIGVWKQYKERIAKPNPGYSDVVSDGEMDPRDCTCHPDDNPPVPCAKQYALSECRRKANESQ